MIYGKRVLLLLLCLLLLSQHPVIVCGTGLEEEASEAAPESPEAALLEEKAIRFLSEYYAVSNLYETGDFITGTLLAYKADDFRIPVDGTLYAAAELKANLRQFANVATFYKFTRSHGMRHGIREFELSFAPLGVSVDGDSAEVELYALGTMFFGTDEDRSGFGNLYRVYFHRIDQDWCIVDVWSEEFQAYGLFKDQFDCFAMMSKFMPDFYGGTQARGNTLHHGSDCRPIVPALSRQ